jgi:hypothetical protein
MLSEPSSHTLRVLKELVGAVGDASALQEAKANKQGGRRPRPSQLASPLSSIGPSVQGDA